MHRGSAPAVWPSASLRLPLLVGMLLGAVLLSRGVVCLEAVSVAVDGDAAASSASHEGEGEGADRALGEPPRPEQQPPHLVRQFDQLEETGEAIATNHRVLASFEGPLLPYTLLETLPHNRAWFTQGLNYYQGYLWEGTGLYGKSKVHRVQLHSSNSSSRSSSTDSLDAAALAAVKSSAALDKQFFGEGLAVVPARSAGGVDRLVQITYKERRGFVYRASDLTVEHEFSYDTFTGHGWGLAYDAAHHELVVSDGSDYLFFWDADSLAETRYVRVTLPGGAPLWHLNELEVVNGSVLANVWYTHQIVKIDPRSGVVTAVYDFTGLHRPGRGEDCFNGIALDAESGDLYVTGKKWRKLYRVRI